MDNEHLLQTMFLRYEAQKQKKIERAVYRLLAKFGIDLSAPALPCCIEAERTGHHSTRHELPAAK